MVWPIDDESWTKRWKIEHSIQCLFVCAFYFNFNFCIRHPCFLHRIDAVLACVTFRHDSQLKCHENSPDAAPVNGLPWCIRAMTEPKPSRWAAVLKWRPPNPLSRFSRHQLAEKRRLSYLNAHGFVVLCMCVCVVCVGDNFSINVMK